MTRVTVAMLGARMHYAVPRLLHEAGLLERFYTDSYVGNKPWLKRALSAIPEPLRPSEIKRWLGRSDVILPPERVTSFEWLGLWYAWARRRACGQADLERVFEKAAVRFSNCISAKGLGGTDVLWGFNSASLELFRLAKTKGMRCILEQTILPKRLMRTLLEEEAARWPGWQPAEEDGRAGAPVGALVAREEQEWALADCIVAGSDFVRSGLVGLGVPEDKITVVPYGVDARRFAAVPPQDETRGNGPLRVLFAGEVGLRKGVPDLLHAFDLLPSGTVELRLAGGVALAADRLAAWRDRVSFLGAVPRLQMPALFQWADVFVLPSIVEGSATVTYEALISGIPVITTPNTGSIVRDGVDGFVVPIRDPAALATAMARYHEDRDLLARHRAAMAESRRMAGLERYREDLVRVVWDVCEPEDTRCLQARSR